MSPTSTADYHRERAETELSKAWQHSGETMLDQVLESGLAAVTHALLSISVGQDSNRALRNLEARLRARITDTKFGGQAGPHAAGYAIAMTHAADMVAQTVDALNEI